jgi:tripartite-type tricarboxylate transporter receptor subunit TctC
MMKPAVVASAVLLCVAGPSAWCADRYPSKPIRLVAPFPPGGGTDLLSRIIADPASQSFGQTVIVDNRPGAGGGYGAEIVARSEPDGHTLILVSASYAATAAYRKLAFDPVAGIQPIILIGTTGLALTVHPSVPAKTTAELIALGKATRGKLNYASVGPGSAVHLALELFKLKTDTDFVHVPYKGGGPALQALVAGEVQLSATSMVPTIPHAKAGRVRILAITTPQPSPALPDVPTINETVPGYEVTHWYGMWFPKGVNKNIVARWNAEVSKVLHTDEMKARTRSEGLELTGGPPEQFGSRLKADVEQWQRVMKDSGMRQQEQ